MPPSVRGSALRCSWQLEELITAYTEHRMLYFGPLVMRRGRHGLGKTGRVRAIVGLALQSWGWRCNRGE